MEAHAVLKPWPTSLQPEDVPVSNPRAMRNATRFQAVRRPFIRMSPRSGREPFRRERSHPTKGLSLSLSTCGVRGLVRI